MTLMCSPRSYQSHGHFEFNPSQIVSVWISITERTIGLRLKGYLFKQYFVSTDGGLISVYHNQGTEVLPPSTPVFAIWKK